MLVVLFALAAAALVAGCGGGSSNLEGVAAEMTRPSKKAVRPAAARPAAARPVVRPVARPPAAWRAGSSRP